MLLAVMGMGWVGSKVTGYVSESDPVFDPVFEKDRK